MPRSTVIEASVHAPHVVEVEPGAKIVPITVRTELRNVSEHDYVLHAHPDDDVHFCQLLDQNHREIWREKPPKSAARQKTDLHPTRCQTIAAGHSINETETLDLESGKLKDGHAYTLRHEIWGHIAETSFVAIRVAKAPAREAKPKKKRPAGKGAPAKK